MSQVKENQNDQLTKSSVFILSRFGQVVGVYSSIENAFVAMQDCVSRGLFFEVSYKCIN